MADRITFAVVAGDGDPTELYATLGAGGVGVSTSHAALSDRRCAACCLLPPLPTSARALARRAAAFRRPVFAFGPCPPALGTSGAWIPVAGLGLWALAWRWRPALAPSLLA